MVSMVAVTAPPPAAAGSWSGEFTVEESVGANFTDARVWASSSGRVAVTWSSLGGGAAATWVRVYDPAGGWHAAARIGTNLYSVPRVLAAAFAAHGTLWIAYDSDEPNPSVRLSLYKSGEGWGPSASFDSVADLGVMKAEMLADLDGDLTLIWATAKDSTGRLLASTSPYGSSSWSDPSRIDNGSGQVRDFDAAGFAGGDVAVAWSIEGASAQELWTARTVSAGMAWNAPLRLREPAGTLILEPRVVAQEPDTISATWIEQATALSSPFRLLSTTRVAGVAWSGVTQIAQSDQVAHVEVASAPQGRAVVVWEQSMGGGTVTCYSHDDRTGNWTGPAALHEGAGSSKAPTVAPGRAGTAWAAWSVVDAGGFSIWAQAYSPSGGWEGEQRISEGPRASTEDPRIALDGRGAVWAVWTDFSPTANRVVVRAGGLPAGEDVSRIQGASEPPSILGLLLVPLALVGVAGVAAVLVWRKPR